MSFASSLIQPSHWPYIAPIILLFLIEPVHDLGVVRPSQVQGCVAGRCHSGELGHRLRRILLRRPRQQDRQRRLFAGGAQDDLRSDHADRVRGLHGGVFQRAVELDAGCGLCPDRARRGAGFSWPNVKAPEPLLRTALSRPEPAGRTKRPGIRYLLPRRNRR